MSAVAEELGEWALRIAIAPQEKDLREERERQQ